MKLYVLHFEWGEYPVNIEIFGIFSSWDELQKAAQSKSHLINSDWPIDHPYRGRFIGFEIELNRILDADYYKDKDRNKLNKVIEVSNGQQCK